MKQLYIGLLFIITTTISFSQTLVTGSVIDAEQGTTIPFVNVVSSNGEATTTDENGNFKIEISSTKDILTVSSIGYNTKSISVGNQSEIKIVLEEATTSLDEVVVTALGLERKTKELGYSVQSIEAEE